MNRSTLISVLWKMYTDQVIGNSELVHYLGSYNLHLVQVDADHIEVSEIDVPSTVYRIAELEK